MIGTPESQNLPQKTCKFSPKACIKNVSVYEAPESEFMWGIKLIDINGEVVCDENWFEYNYNQEW